MATSNLTSEEKAQLKVVAGPFILSYPNLFTPVTDDNGKEKYSAALVSTPETKRDALDRAVKLAIKDKWGTKVPANLRMPIRADAADVAEKGYPAGSFFLNVRSEQKPGIVDGSLAKVEDRARVYPGVIVNVALRAFGYDVSGNKGVSFSLDHVQIVKDGPRLDGRKAAEETFAPLSPGDLEEAMKGIE
jgi:hypothetical protein